MRLGLAFSLALACGCGNNEEGPPRLPVSGRVTLDQKPLDSGTISFLPEGPGATATGEVAAGEFRLGRNAGPSAGRYKVAIFSSHATGKQIRTADGPATTEEVVNIVPDRYNAKTDLRADVKPDGENDFQFDLSSRPDPKRRLR